MNRILAKLLGEAMHAVDTGTPFDVVDASIKPFGLPMTPFELLELVGLKVGAHVLDTHHAAFPDRFFESDEPAQARGATVTSSSGTPRARSRATTRRHSRSSRGGTTR